jgi:hypothetical protein
MRAAEFSLGLLYLSSLLSFVLYLFDFVGLERVLKGVQCVFLPIDLSLILCVLVRMLAGVWYMLTMLDGCCTRLLYLYRFGLGRPSPVDSGVRPFYFLLFGFHVVLFFILFLIPYVVLSTSMPPRASSCFSFFSVEIEEANTLHNVASSSVG